MGEQKMRFYTSVCLQVVLVEGLWGSVAAGFDPNVLIDRYGVCARRLETIFCEIETTQENKDGRMVYSLQYCSDNNRKQWIGRQTRYNQDGTVNESSSSFRTDIFDDRQAVHLEFYNPSLANRFRLPRARLARRSRDRWLQDYVETPPYGGSLAGHFMGNNGYSILDLLKGATCRRFENKATEVMGYDAWLMEADTPYGAVRAWISPRLDYNCLKWEIAKGSGQYYRDGQFVNEGWSGTATFDAEKADQVEGRYIVTQARLNYRVEGGGKVVADDTYHFSLKNVDLSPDYEALGAFAINLPEGTEATHEDIPGRVFQWTRGKFVPDLDEYLPRSLIGKPLPSLEGFAEGVGQDYGIGRRVLVCFWDMQQRSSRNAVQMLAERERELEDKGVVVFLVHAGDVRTDALHEWIAEKNIPFTSGRITVERETALLHWGVRARPWLILTDDNHIVTSEGLSMTDLD